MEQPEISPALAEMLSCRQDQRAKSEQVFSLVSEFMRITARSVPASHRVWEEKWGHSFFSYEIHPASLKETPYLVSDLRCKIMPGGTLYAAGTWWSVEKPEKSMIHDRYDREPVERLFDADAATVEQTSLRIIDFLCHAGSHTANLENWVEGVFNRLPQAPRVTFRPD